MVRTARQSVEAPISSLFERAGHQLKHQTVRTTVQDANLEIEGRLGIPAAELTPNVRAALTKMQAQINALRTDRSKLSQRLRQAEDLADTDTLVPVFNRRAFVRELTRVMSFAQRYDVQASLVYFDLDGFKQLMRRCIA